MRVLQLIDSLEAGGAERVAVNYANSLTKYVEASYLCTTRAEGILKEHLADDVNYLFLAKRSTLDIRAIKKLSRFIKTNHITIVHAHASSFFIGTIVKVFNPKLQLIWHEHYGNRGQTSKVSQLILKLCSYYFSSVIAVNKALKQRSQQELLTPKVYHLANYPIIDALIKQTTLQGKSGCRIVCLANLRPDKDHINLLTAFAKIQRSEPDWTLHLVGHYSNDTYYRTITNFINENNLATKVFFYGSCSDVNYVLQQSDIAVLSSKSEGLPLALLEYGLATLPVVATNVGDCNQVILHKNTGILVPSKNAEVLAEAILTYINNVDLRTKMAECLYTKVKATFSEDSILNALIKIYKA